MELVRAGGSFPNSGRFAGMAMVCLTDIIGEEPARAGSPSPLATVACRRDRMVGMEHVPRIVLRLDRAKSLEDWPRVERVGIARSLGEIGVTPHWSPGRLGFWTAVE